MKVVCFTYDKNFDFDEADQRDLRELYVSGKKIFAEQVYIFPLRQIKIHNMERRAFYTFLKFYALRLLRAEVSTRASAASYSIFMSFFPFILFLFSVTSRLPHSEEIRVYLHNWIMQLFPLNTGQSAWETIDKISLRIERNLSLWSIIFSLIFSTNGIYFLIERFDHGKRVFWKRYITSFLLTIILTALIASILLLLYYSQVVWRFFIDVNIPGSVLSLISYMSIWFSFFIGMLLLYGIGSKNRFYCKDRIPGALLTACLFAGVSFLFGIYIRNFSNYNLLYGSIGTLLILMLWLYINNILILSGHELNETIARIKKFKNIMKNPK
ncbi:MAG: YihY/virulence factor BrkB family protein [Flavobacteriales bacterium Tduv]